MNLPTVRLNHENFNNGISFNMHTIFHKCLDKSITCVQLSWKFKSVPWTNQLAKDNGVMRRDIINEKAQLGKASKFSEANFMYKTL